MTDEQRRREDYMAELNEEAKARNAERRKERAAPKEERAARRAARRAAQQEETKARRKVYRRVYHAERREEINARARVRRKTGTSPQVWQMRIIRRLREQRGCEICWQTFPAPALDFHHRDPSEKEFALTNKKFRPWDEMLAELNKCAVLCATCHRLVHAGLVELPTEAI